MQTEEPPRDLTAASRAGSFPLFDWLRFVLASAVALDHSGWQLGLSGLAVQTFFALSGWLIGGILLGTEKRDLPRFFYKRGTRIWAPYLVAVAALYGLAWARAGFTPGYFHYLFHDLTFTHNWFVDFQREKQLMPLEGTGGHFWSISVEEQFYLAAPLVMLGFAWGKGRGVWVAVAALAGVLAWWNFQYVAISFGVLAAVLHRDYGDWHLAGWARAIFAATAAITLSAMLGGGFLIGNVYNALAPLFAISVVLLTAVEGRRGAAGVFLGGLSYPLYLNHWIGIFAAHYVGNCVGGVTLPLTVAAAYLCALAVSTLAYLLVDRNIQRERNRFYRPALGKGFMAVAYTLCALGLTLGLIGGA